MNAAAIEKSLEQAQSPAVFISYARRDSLFVNDLVRSLRDGGIDVWLDQTRISGGQNFRQSIANAIRERDCFIIVVSPYSMKSGEVKREVELAIELKKTIIPVLLQSTDLPAHLELLQWVDFRISYERGLRTLLGRLRNEEEEPALAIPPRPARWGPIVPLLFIVCPPIVKAVAAELFLSAGIKAGVGFLSLSYLKNDDAAMCAIFSSVAAICAVWAWASASRRFIRGEMIAPALLVAGIPFIGLAFEQSILFVLLLFLTPLDLLSLGIILFSKTYRRWMPAYPSWAK